MGSVQNPKIVFGEEAHERGSNRKEWDEPLSEEDEIEPVQPSLRGLPGKFGN
jgi:hypothetical protein